MASWFDLDILNPAFWPLIGTQINTTGGGGAGAIIFAITSGGVITSLNIISGTPTSGSYTSNFSATITGAGTGASVTLTVSGGNITGYSSLVGGTGYAGTSPSWKLNFLANVWSALCSSLAAWRDNVNGNTKTLSNLGNLSFASGSGILSDIGIVFGTGGGTANAQTVTNPQPRTALVLGQGQLWLPSHANTSGVPTLAVDGLSAIQIIRGNPSSLAANDLQVNLVAFAIFDGTYWDLQNPATRT